jgi:hypothetical protein
MVGCNCSHTPPGETLHQAGAAVSMCSMRCGTDKTGERVECKEKATVTEEARWSAPLYPSNHCTALA